MKRWSASIHFVKCSHNRRSQAGRLGGHSGCDTSLWLGSNPPCWLCQAVWSVVAMLPKPDHSGDTDECDNIDCELMALCWSPFFGVGRGGGVGVRFSTKILLISTTTTTTKIKTFPCIFPTSLSPFTFSSYWKWFLPCCGHPQAVCLSHTLPF